MKTDGSYWIDESGNMWFRNAFTERQAEDHSKTLVNCEGMINSGFCQNCRDCELCFFCHDCHRCQDTTFSRGTIEKRGARFLNDYPPSLV